MDKASASGAGDCGFESHQGRVFITFPVFFFPSFTHMKTFFSPPFSKTRCLIRVLDSFGTEPQFNYKKWKPPMKSRKGRDNGKIWGNWNLNPRQFLTMYRKLYL